MVFLFRDKAITSIIYLLLLALATHVHFFLTPALVVAQPNEGLIGLFLTKFIQPLPASIIFVIYLVLILVQAIRLNVALNNYKMFQQQHYTVAMCYILFSGFFTEWSSITPALIANSLIIWIFIKLANLNNNANPKTLLFNIGLIAGITILCYHPTISLVGITFFALAIVRPFRIAEWLILLMGLVIPFYFLGCYLYLTNNIQFLKTYLPNLQLHLPLQNANFVLWIGVLVLIISVVIGVYYNQVNSNRMVIQIRKSWAVMFVLLLLMLPLPFIFKNATLDSAALSLIPLSAFAANMYSYPKKLALPNILFWLSATFIAYNNWLLVKK